MVCGCNVAAHIDRCLSSLVAADYPALEVIYCDDGSTDESLALDRVKVIELPHRGLAATRNAGLKGRER